MYMVNTYGAFAELPDFYGDLFEVAGRGSYYLSVRPEMS